MLLTKLTVGEILQVPAGADICRRQAYAVRVTDIWKVSTDASGFTTFFVYGDRLRVDGTPTRRKGKKIVTFVRPERSAWLHA